MTAPTTLPRDGEGWRRSPDLLTIDDKCDAAFGPMDERGKKAEALLIGTATYGRSGGGR